MLQLPGLASPKISTQFILMKKTIQQAVLIIAEKKKMMLQPFLFLDFCHLFAAVSLKQLNQEFSLCRLLPIHILFLILENKKFSFKSSNNLLFPLTVFCILIRDYVVREAQHACHYFELHHPWYVPAVYRREM